MGLVGIGKDLNAIKSCDSARKFLGRHSLSPLCPTLRHGFTKSQANRDCNRCKWVRTVTAVLSSRGSLSTQRCRPCGVRASSPATPTQNTVGRLASTSRCSQALSGISSKCADRRCVGTGLRRVNAGYGVSQQEEGGSCETRAVPEI